MQISTSALSRVSRIVITMLALGALTPIAAHAQRALVYCPAPIDAAGCDNAVNALATAFPGGIDRGYDGSSGTVDLKTVDLFAYSVIVVPSLADGAQTPYALLRNATVQGRLHTALLGRVALWSGTPDQGTSNRALKDALIQNLATWAAGNFAAVKGPGLVAFQDLSDTVSARYGWVKGVAGLTISPDSAVFSYASVRSVTATGLAILTSNGAAIAYTNMASLGFLLPQGAAGVTLDAVGQTGTTQGGQIVLLTSPGANNGTAVVTTDQDDYTPGTMVTITGSGFQPGETVTMTLLEDPNLDQHPPFTSVADASGKFVNASFSPDVHDVDVRFILTAVGATSGMRAEGTFTDAKPQMVTLVTPSSPNPVPAGTSGTYTVTVNFNGNGVSCTALLSGTPTASPSWGTAPAGGFFQFSPGSLTSSGGNPTATLTISTTTAMAPNTYHFTVTANGSACSQSNSATSGTIDLVVSAPLIITANGGTTSNAAPSVFNQSVTFTTTLSPSTATGTIQFKDGATNLGAPVALSGGVATLTTSSLAVGSHAISAVYTPGTGFAAGTVTGVTQVVNKATATVTLGNLAQTYTGSALSATATTAPTGLTVALTYNGVGTAPTAAGSYAVVATVNDASYQGTASGTLVIAQATQAALILGGAPASAAYGSQFTVAPSGGSGTGAYAVSTSGACSNAGNVVTMTSGAGTCSVKVDRAGDTNFLAATQITGSVSATKATLTPSITAQSRVYDGTTSATASGSVTGTVGTDVITLGITSATFANKNVANGKTVTATGLTLSGPQSANYILSATTATTTANITARTLTISAAGVNRPYDGSTNATVTLGDDRVSGDIFTTAYASATFGDKHVANGKTITVTGITTTGADAGNYTANTTATATANITPASLTITASSPADILYGSPAPAITAGYAGFLGGDIASVVTGLTCGTTYAAGNNIGPYPTTCSGGSATDYGISYVAGSFNVTKASLSVIANDQTKMYGDPNPAFSGTLTGVFGSDGITASYGTTATASSDVGSYAITATLADPNNKLGNYTVTNTSGHLVVTQAPLSVTPANANRLYGGTNPPFSGAIVGIKNGDAISATYATSAVATSPVGNYLITATLVDPSGKLPNYGVTTNTGQLAITPAPLSVTTNASTRLYGNANPAFSVGYVGFVNSETSTVLSGTLGFATAAVTGSDVGAYPVTPSGLTSTNYTITFDPGSLVITKAPLSVTANDKTRLYGAADPVFDGLLSGIKNSDNITATYASTAVAGSGVGSYPIAPTLVDPSNRLPNYQVTSTNGHLAITPAPLSVTVDNLSRLYGDPNPTLTGTVTGVVNSDGITATYATSATLTSNIGTYPITASLVDPGSKLGNYTVSNTAGQLTVTQAPLSVTPADAGRLYGGANPVFSGTITGIKNGDNITATYATAAVATSPVGNYSITATIVDPGGRIGNYTPTLHTGTLAINPAPLSVTTDPSTKIYGDPNPTFAAGFTGFVNGETSAVLGGTLAFSTAAVTGSDVGTYPVTPSGLTSTNYTITFDPGSLVITKAPLSVTANDKTRLYGAADPVFDGLLSGIKNSDNITATYASTAVAGSGVGSYPIAPTLVDPSNRLPNYQVTSTNGHLAITPAPLNVTAQDAHRTYGAANPAFGVNYSGFVLGETPSVLGGTLSEATTATPASPVGGYPIVASGLTSSNYAITFHDGTLTVDPAPLSVTVDNLSRLYGDPNPTLTGTVTGVVNSDGITATYATSATLTSNIGTYPITASLVDPGSKLGNYTVSNTAGQLTITQAPLSVTPADAGRLYGGANPVFSGTITGIKNGDAISATYATSAVATSPVGNYLITATLVDPSGKLPNYGVTTNTGQLAITPAPLSVTTNASIRMYGNANPAFSVGYVGFVNGETSAVLGGTLAFSTAAVQGSAIGTYPVTPSGLTSTNYALTFAPGNLVITQAPLSVVANNQTRVYGAPNPTLDGTITGIKNSDNITATYATSAVATTGIGSYPIVPTLVDPTGKLGNYLVTSTSGALAITQAALVIKANDATKIYGTPNPPFSGSVVSGVVNGDLIVVTASSVATISSVVGTYPIVPSASGTAIANYHVTATNGTLTVTPWTFIGFDDPVNMSALNTAKGGSTIPLKFQVFAGPPGSPEITDPSLVQSIVARGATCPGTTEVPTDTTADATGGTVLRWDGSRFIYNWKTPKTIGCYALTVTMIGNSTLSANFKLK